MRIIFIGIHNKPGMKPLDSKTKSGKNIDAIIANFPGIECIKTNLYSTEFMPAKHLQKQLVDEFFVRVKIEQHTDLAVLLGYNVIAHLSNDLRLPFYSLCVGHPSLIFSKYTKEQYISEVTELIKKQSILNVV